MVSIYGLASCEKVDAEFMKLFKQGVVSFSATLSTSWIPCSQEDLKEDAFLSDIADQDYIVSKQAQDGTRTLYQYLNEEHGFHVRVDGFDKDYIAGSKENVESFLGYLHTTSENIKASLYRSDY